MKPGQSLLMVMWLCLLMTMLPYQVKSQTLVEVGTNQAPVLTANAGDDVTIDVGDSVMLGGMPAGTGGTGILNYYWDPPKYINHAAIPNPTVAPPGNITYTLLVSDEHGCYVSDDIFITVIGGTGLADYNTEGHSLIYPNPGNGSFTLEIPDDLSGEINVEVISMSGLVLHHEIIPRDIVPGSVEIDLTRLQRGNYILRLAGDNKKVTHQIILNK